MALAKQRVAFRFAGGIDTEPDEKAVPATKLLGLENGVFTKAISVVKRNGYEARARAISGSASLLTGARRLAKRGDELLAFTNNRCYSNQTDADEWTDAGAVICAIGADKPAVRTGTQQTMPDHATNGGLTAFAWEDSRGGVWWAAVNAKTGRVCRGPEQLDAAGERPRCVAVGDAVHVYWARPANRRIYVVVVNPSNPVAAVVQQIVIEDLSTANPVYDAVPTNRTGSPALIVWAEHATTNVRIGYVNSGGQLGSPANGHPSVLTSAVALSAASPLAVAYLSDVAGNEIGLVYQSGGQFKASFYSSLGADATSPIAAVASQVINAATTLKRVGCAYTADASRKLWTVAEEDAAQPSNHFCISAYAMSTPASGVVTTIRSVGLASRAFQAGDAGDVFAAFVHDTTYFNTYLTFRLGDYTPVGRHVPGLAAALPTRTHVSSVHVVDDVAAMCLPYRERLFSENADKFRETGLRLVSLDFDSEDSHQTAELGRGLYLAAACPLHYDGRVWTEQGFSVGPELITAAKAGGGALTPGVTYSYRAWYEWTDTQGEVHRGPTSIGTEVVMIGTEVVMGGGDMQVTLTIPTLRVTSKQNVRICVARCRANDETEFFRVTSADPNTAGAVNGYVPNDPTIDTVTLIDRMSDAVLATQESVYTDGGILSNDPAPLGSIVFAAKSRLFFTDSGDSNVVRYSQELDEGYGVECPPELRLPCNPKGGPITAIAEMDGLVFAFKRSAIFVAGGDGPLPNGDASQSGFTRFEELTSDVGCSDPSSIALTPIGLVFKSEKGIYLLDRSRSVIDIGGPVRAFDAQAVRRATVMPGRTAVLFLTNSGKSLYYDYKRGQWSTFTNHEGLDAAVVNGRYHYLRADNRVFRETIGVHTDAGRRIPLVFETAWLHLDEILQGWQRFYHVMLLGSWKSAHQLEIRFRSEYGKHWSEPAYMDATGLAAGATGWITGDRARPIGEEPIGGSVYGEGAYGDGPYGGTHTGLYQWRAHLGLVGQAIQFRFEDFEADGHAGAGYELSELVLIGGIKGPAKRPFTGARST